jgi:aryl-alcohol dehydrogenase-like predicted oxidoreductase
VHLWDPRTGLEETMRALDDAVRAGKVLHLGISDTPAWVVAQANTDAAWRGRSPFVVVQARYSLLSREAERDIIPAAEALGMSVAAWSPLGGGVLSGKFTRPDGPGGPTRVPPAAVGERDLAVARATADVAADLGSTPARVALAWTTHRSPVVHPILGARSVEQLADTLGAADLALPREAVDRLDRAAAFELGFPHDFVRDMQGFVFGDVAEQVDP